MGIEKVKRVKEYISIDVVKEKTKVVTFGTGSSASGNYASINVNKDGNMGVADVSMSLSCGTKIDIPENANVLLTAIEYGGVTQALNIIRPNFTANYKISTKMDNVDVSIQFAKGFFHVKQGLSKHTECTIHYKELEGVT